ncbi:MAG: hypothetical protein VX463_07945, partial [Pseudomonadota bacterium]|nr:hypothetical protein [Pseudomonadota bacterium]
MNASPFPPGRAGGRGFGLALTLVAALIAGAAAHERKNDEDLVAQYLRISTTRIPDMRPEGIPEAVC